MLEPTSQEYLPLSFAEAVAKYRWLLTVRLLILVLMLKKIEPFVKACVRYKPAVKLAFQSRHMILIHLETSATDGGTVWKKKP